MNHRAAKQDNEMPVMTPPSAESLQSVVQDWADARQVTSIAIVTDSRSILSEQTVLAVWSKMVTKFDAIDLIIQSNGGDPHTAYQIVEILRRHLKNPSKGLTAVVPLRAVSAATLMCLGCDEIMLDELARLGPLDMQVYEDRKGGGFRYKSALNPQMAIKQLNEFAQAQLRSTKLQLVRDGVLADEAYELAIRFVVGLYSSLYSQINPERLGEYRRALDVNVDYARSLLKRYSKLSVPDQIKLAEKLVSGYPSHGYYIDFREAVEINLPVVSVPPELELLALKLLTQMDSGESEVVFAEPTSRGSRRDSSRRPKQPVPKVALSNGSAAAAAKKSTKNGRGRKV